MGDTKNGNYGGKERILKIYYRKKFKVVRLFVKSIYTVIIRN